MALAPGTLCAESFVFAPTITGPRAVVATFSPVAGNSVSANFSGTAVNLVLTTLTITQTAPTTSTVSYGQSTTFVAKLTSNTSTGTSPTGTVTFVVDGVNQTPQPISGAGNTLTNNLGVATHFIGASYSGDSGYASGNATFSLTVKKSATVTTLSSAQNVNGVSLTAVVAPSYTGALGPTGTVTFFVDNVAQSSQPVGSGTVTQVISVADGTHAVSAAYSGDGDYSTSTSTTSNLVVQRTATATALNITAPATATTVSLRLAATVTGAGGTPSGTVTFYNGTTRLGTVILSGGSATLLTATTSNYSFTATYSGDGLFQPSTLAITETPDFAVLTPSASVVVPQGGQTVATISVVSVANYTGSMTATCTNLPANSLCRFAPTPLMVSPGVNGNLGVQVFVGISSQVASIGWPIGRNPSLWLLSMLLGGVSLAGLRRRRGSRWAGGLLSLLALCALAIGAGGCGQINAASFQNQTYVTPAGTYPVAVGITDTNNVTHTVTLNVQVNSQ
jgi:hypothetical protein